MKKVFILLLIVAFANLSCSHFYSAVNEDISEFESDDEIKLILKSGRIFVGDSLSYSISDSDTTIFLSTDSTKVSVQLNEVEKLYINKTDYIGTVFVVLFGTVITLYVGLRIAFGNINLGG